MWVSLPRFWKVFFWETSFPTLEPTPQALALARSWLQYWHLRANPPLLKMHTHQLLPKRFSLHQSALFDFFSSVGPLVIYIFLHIRILVESLYHSILECLLNHTLIKMTCIVYIVNQQKSIAWKGRELSQHIFLVTCFPLSIDTCSVLNVIANMHSCVAEQLPISFSSVRFLIVFSYACSSTIDPRWVGQS